MNIIISRKNYQHGGALTCKDLDEAIDQAKKTGSEEICIIGGAQIYALALPLANRVYLTRVHQSPEGDAFFPELGKEWKETNKDSRGPYTFLTYERA